MSEQDERIAKLEQRIKSLDTLVDGLSRALTGCNTGLMSVAAYLSEGQVEESQRKLNELCDWLGNECARLNTKLFGDERP